MSNGNGFVWKVIISIIIPILMFMGTNLIASDKESRSRDEKIIEKITLCTEEQNRTNTAILVALSEIKADVKYIKSSKE